VRSLAPRLTRDSAELLQEFLRLNRRRIRPNPALSTRELDRWEELRSQIEERLSGPRGRRSVRKSLRAPADLRVHYSDAARAETTRTREIAEGGLFLATDSPPPVGTPLQLKLTGDNGEMTDVEGAVVWVRRAGDPGGPPGIGVEFADLDVAQREAVAYLVEQALAAL